MARRARIRLAGMLAATLPSMLLAGAASSQTFSGGGVSVPAGSDGVTNVQVQEGDVFASQTLDVVDAAGALAATTAVGNIVSAAGTGAPLQFHSDQALRAPVTAKTTLNATGYVNNVLSTTSATGNSATAGACCGALTGHSSQDTRYGSDVTARSRASVNYADSVGVDSTAVGNTQGWYSDKGSTRVSSYQVHGGATHARTDARANVVYGDAAYTASAVGNNVSADTRKGPVEITAEQHADNATSAVTTVEQGYAYNLLGSAAATGNNVNVTASNYAAQMGVDQTNGGPVSSNADVKLDSWYGSGTALSYAMANSAILSNNGSYAGVENAQSNLGDVTARASFSGGAGGDAMSSATAVGNAVSGYACSECQGTLEANNRQVNSGAVRSYSTFSAGGSMGTATGISTAVGNTATFQVVGSGGR